MHRAMGCNHWPPAVSTFFETVVEIEVPQRPDVLGFVTADLARLSPSFGAGLARASVRHNHRFLEQTVGLHVTLDRGIRREPPQ